MKIRIILICIASALLLISCARQAKEDAIFSVTELPRVEATTVEPISPNGIFELEAKIVRKEINGKEIRMFGYNGQIPGPVLKVKQNSNVTIKFRNSLDLPTTVHWHGILLENKYDGVPNITQPEIAPGQTFSYELRFPHEGIYWYHPHIREDLQQEYGLYGSILVEPANFSTDFDKDEILFFDDLWIEDGDLSFLPDKATHALMGRFGNVLLVNGKTNYSLTIEKGEILRLYLIDSANTRMFNFSIEGTKFRVVGGDASFYEKEFLSDSVVLGPGERAIVDVIFTHPGAYKLMNQIPQKTYALGIINVIDSSLMPKNLTLKLNTEVSRGMQEVKQYINASPDFTFDLSVDLPAMKDHSMRGDDGEDIEWEDTMPAMNAVSTSKNTKWILRDRATGKENMDATHQVKKGEIKKIRFYNDPKSTHPMQHPLHLHGQRFILIAEDGKINDNLVWKDVVVVPKGKTVDIIVEFTNPGHWMFHCHIAEHLEAGMMTVFEVS